jgi:hypothetical protein
MLTNATFPAQIVATLWGHAHACELSCGAHMHPHQRASLPALIVAKL